MDYLDIYNENYSLAFSKAEEMIKQKLIACKEDKRDANFALNKSREFLESYNQNSIIAKNRSLTNLERVFQQSLGYYSEDRILMTLKKEIFEFYNKLTSNDLPENYSFLIMIADLADYKGTQEVLRLFQNQSTLYQMMYELNDFSQFKIEYYGNTNYQDTPLFNNLRDRLYPKVINYLPLENEETIDNLNDSSYNAKTITKDKINFKNENSERFKNSNENTLNSLNTVKKLEIEDKLNQFEEDEKYLILHCFYKIIAEKKFDSKNIELSEFLRLIRICQNIEDITVFDKKYTKKFYKRVSDGLQYSSNLSYRKKLKERTLNKLNDLQVHEVEEYMKGLKI